jgi:hypothetical protein
MARSADTCDSEEGLRRMLTGSKTIEDLSTVALVRVVDHAVENAYINHLTSLVAHGVDLSNIRRNYHPLLSAVFEVANGPGVEMNGSLGLKDFRLRAKRLSIVQCLLQNGCDTSTVYEKESVQWNGPKILYTVLDVATFRGSYDLLKILLRHGVEIPEKMTLCVGEKRDKITDLRISRLMGRLLVEAVKISSKRKTIIDDVFSNGSILIVPEIIQYIKVHAMRPVTSLDIDIEEIIACFDKVDYRCRWL